MLERLLDFSIRQRGAVVLAVAALGMLGIFSLSRLPIDAVPDITNNQVVLSTLVPSLSPVEVEKQITFPIETALSGIPGLSYTRSLSRNGFSEITAVFEDDVNIYFARQQVAERIGEVRSSLGPDADPRMARSRPASATSTCGPSTSTRTQPRSADRARARNPTAPT